MSLTAVGVDGQDTEKQIEKGPTVVHETTVVGEHKTLTHEVRCCVIIDSPTYEHLPWSFNSQNNQKKNQQKRKESTSPETVLCILDRYQQYKSDLVIENNWSSKEEQSCVVGTCRRAHRVVRKV